MIFRNLVLKIVTLGKQIQDLKSFEIKEVHKTKIFGVRVKTSFNFHFGNYAFAL